jgi:hypothetical protein
VAAKPLFSLDNNIFQNGQQGICTVISFNWAKYTLKKGKGLQKREDIPLSTHILNIQQGRNRWDDPIGETPQYLGRYGLALVAATDVNTYAAIEEFTKNTAPHVAVFWNSHHTMGYRYAHNEKEFFDPELGLYRAKLTKNIDAKIKEVFIQKNYDVVQRCIVVKLLDQ